MNIKQLFCKHTFALEDLELTNIPPLAVPKTRGYEEWAEYFTRLYTHKSITKRVKWPCSKCDKIFYAHCGLDIAHNGNIVRKNV